MIIDEKEIAMNIDGEKYDEGYRIVYFYVDHYKVGAYARNIEDFMVGFATSYPLYDEGDIPKFISNDDLLERYLNRMTNIIGVAIYNVNGTNVLRKDRKKLCQEKL